VRTLLAVMAFVFGGSISGLIPREKPVDLTEREINPAMPSEHTEVIARLSEQEERLLSELERTRARLLAELESEKVDEPEQQSESESPFWDVTSIGVDQSVTQSTKFGTTAGRSTRKKMASKTSAPTVGRAHMDLIPVLTSTGVSPFEVGLPSGPGATMMSQSLPIFKLPPVRADSKFVNKIPVIEEPTEEELDTREKDRVENEKLKMELGLTDEELREFSGQVHMIEHGANAQDTQDAFAEAELVLSDRNTAIPPLATGEITRSKKGGRKRTRKVRMVNRRTPRCLKGRNTNFPSYGQSGEDELREELGVAVKCVQGLQEKVKNDIMRISDICPITSIKAQIFMQKWGLQRLEWMFQKMQFSIIISALERWHDFLDHARKTEKREAYMKYKGTQKLDLFMKNWSRRHMVHAWHAWAEIVTAAQAIEQHKLEDEMARRLQGAYRVHRAREFMKVMRNARERQREEWAASKIQAIYRGKNGRSGVNEILQARAEEAAALLIQNKWRSKVARNTLEQMLEAKEIHEAAKLIQNNYRGRLGRRLYEEAKDLRARNNAACMVQRRFRGLWGRRKFLNIKQQKKENMAAAKMQSRYRGLAGRKKANQQKAKKSKRERMLDTAATQIQRVYRGHRGRLKFILFSTKKRQEMMKENAAASMMQRAYRCKQARKAVEMAKDIRKQQMIAAARYYTEFWDDESNQWFYFNSDDGEAMWEPPESGYVKADGMLVLENGETIKDPDAPDEVEEGDTKMCIECNEDEADKFCHQCEDNYCNKCFAKMHAAGKRKEHTFDQVGPIRCIECEIEKATKIDWCDDPYCDPCYDQFHKKGNKASKKFKPIAAAIAEKKAAEEAAKEWVQFFDEENGYPYWYNNITGESSYDKPAVLVAQEEEEAAAGQMVEAEADPYASDYGGEEGYNSDYQGAEAAAGGASEWKEEWDEASGTTYWYNETSGESTYDDPTGGGDAAAYDSDYAGSANYESDYAGAEVAAGGTTDWVEYQDESSGAPYWFSESTGESSYERPDGW
jgi:hypothetical protein